MKSIEVVAAIIENENQFLCVKRAKSKYPYISMKFEFPGGKVEVGESLEQAIIREISEELNLSISVKSHLSTVTHDYPDFRIKMHGYLCTCENRVLVLREHLDAVWANRDALSVFDWAAADIPFVDLLQSNEYEHISSVT
jgi:8-oxo-dGTP diphosphatase